MRFDLADPKKSLFQKWQPANRFANFGAAVVSSTISGFRGISAEVQFEYPVTALSGFNGSGKSTVGQLMLCAYKRLENVANASPKRHYVVSYFPVSPADPTPFADQASIVYRYQTPQPETLQEVTLSRAQKEWSGYKRQPPKNTQYIGFTIYVPKIERPDMSIYSAKSLILSERQNFSNAAQHASVILGTAYDEVFFQGITAKQRGSELGMAKRFGSTYSENNMGLGEGRVVHTVRLLETCPEKSLVVLEEPETSLHENAQYEFAKYLIDVSNRRGHQIIFSTHSSKMMNALPPEGRKLLVRTQQGVKVHDQVSSSRIKTALSAGETGHSVICVEDDFAQSLLREILRRYDLNLASTVAVEPFGDTRAVVNAKNVLTQAGVQAIAVRDADKGADEANQVLSLPGNLPPEKEVFESPQVQAKLLEMYGVDFSTVLAMHPGLDHHKYAEVCCEKAQTSREVLETDCIRAFLDAKGPDWFQPMCAKISGLLHY